MEGMLTGKAQVYIIYATTTTTTTTHSSVNRYKNHKTQRHKHNLQIYFTKANGIGKGWFGCIPKK